jgi:hypothetical protein
MVTAVGASRGSHDETPFPLELDVVARRKRVVRREGQSQDETAPFPLEFELVARRARHDHDETSPFLLDFMAILPGGEAAFVRTARPPRSRGTQRSSCRGLPRLTWHGAEASRALREYAARIAAGESLPPYRGPILETGDSPRVVAQSAARTVAPELMTTDSKPVMRRGLALIAMTALVVASALLGDDAALRNLGQSISDWFSGSDAVPMQMQRPSERAQR